MNFDTPFVEYLIIGTHTSSWILLFILYVFKIPMRMLKDTDVAAALFLLPIIYLFGMLFDSLYQGVLNKYRIKIRDQTLEYPRYKDEIIALESPTLYASYEVRMRRVRVIGAAIFNWPLLAITVLLTLGFRSVYYVVIIIFLAILLTLASIKTWKGLFKRAYKFRKNSIDEIYNKTNHAQGRIKNVKKS